MRAEEYVKLPYTRIIQEINDKSGHYFYGRIMELDGCQSTGDTLDELYQNLNEALGDILKPKLKITWKSHVLLPWKILAASLW